MQRKSARIGVVGMGRSGKTLLLKTLFNGQKVRDLFDCGSLLGSLVYMVSLTSLQVSEMNSVDK